MRRAQCSSSRPFSVRALWRHVAALPSSAEISVVHGLQRCLNTEATTQAPADINTTAAATATRHSQRQLRLSVVRPDLLDDWIPELNDVDAQRISCADAVTPVWWRCPRCYERYQSTVQSRVARGHTACPHCGGLGSAGMTKNGSTTAAKVDKTSTATATPASLADTHPALAARWDTARNGGLLPSQVTASSTRQVWWRPPPTSPSQQSFRRPVFAFVYNAASPDEQAAATAALEWKLLARIREAARIEEAERLGALPVTLFAGGGEAGNAEEQGLSIKSNSSSSSGGALHDPSVRKMATVVDAAPEGNDHKRASSAALGGYAEASVTAVCTRDAAAHLSPEDAAAVALLWKQRAKKYLANVRPLVSSGAAAQAYDGATPSGKQERATEATMAAVALPRELFAYTFAPVPPARFNVAASSPRVSHRRTDAAAIVRETLLNHYSDFVNQQRTKGASSAKQQQPSPVLSLDGKGNGEDGSWVDYFRLTAEEVKPQGYTDPDATLYFPVTPEKKSATATTPTDDATAVFAGTTTAVSKKSRSPFPTTPAASLSISGPSDFNIASNAELIFAYYPRRPRNPPAWEDDVAESVPPMSDVTTEFSTDANQMDNDTDSFVKNNNNNSSAKTRAAAEGGLMKRKFIRASGFRIEAPFGRSGATERAAQLSTEYDADDDDSSNNDDSGAALASELRTSGDDVVKSKTRGNLVSEEVNTGATSASLVNSAIAALGAAFHTTSSSNDIAVEFADPNSRRYHRGVQPALMEGKAERRRTSSKNRMNENDGAAAAAMASDEEESSNTRYNFRLSMPQAGLGGSLSWRRLRTQVKNSKKTNPATDVSSATTAAAAAIENRQQQQETDKSSVMRVLPFDAPQTPRKVARPRRLRKEAADVAPSTTADKT